ncbi:hypothetical protein [Streptomyces melanogenes]|uniref:hypothetical protein n=1 Tax=Streptomyces melanogenes TaxID=67326 RepID=UPI00167CD4A7|nr:hypothetical protein [Streptomyces melanogenes]GGP40462.1 hypothetical protein GCM10010278_16500 [Streptomyces melanogenes]
MTGDELFPLTLPGPVAVCCDCHGITRAPIPVRWIQSTSGPGTTLYVCPDCAPRYSPGPQWDELPAMRR